MEISDWILGWIVIFVLLSMIVLTIYWFLNIISLLVNGI